jgi:hypothetical protein
MKGPIFVQPIQPFWHPPIGFRPPGFGEDVSYREEISKLEIARFVAMPFEVEFGAAQRGVEQEFRQGALPRGLARPFFDGHDDRGRLAVAFDDLRFALGAIDHFRQPRLVSATLHTS